MDPRSPKQRIGPDRRPETLPDPIPADPATGSRPQKRKKMCPTAARETAGRTHPRQMAQQQSQIEAADRDQQSLAPVGVAPDEDPTQPSRAELGRDKVE